MAATDILRSVPWGVLFGLPMGYRFPLSFRRTGGSLYRAAIGTAVGGLATSLVWGSQAYFSPKGPNAPLWQFLAVGAAIGGYVTYAFALNRERKLDIRRCAAELLLVERAREWLLEDADA